MRFYIPSSNDKIRLIENWRFRLFSDFRNYKFIETIFGFKDSEKFLEKLQDVDFNIEELSSGHKISIFKGSPKYRHSWGAGGDFVVCYLPAGTVLNIQSVEIKTGKEQYDSIVLSLLQDKDFSFLNSYNSSFCIKINDINCVQFEKYFPEDQEWVADADDFQFKLLEI